VHSVDQRPNLRHLCEPLEGTEGLIKAVGFKKTTESMRWRTSANVNREWVPNWARNVHQFGSYTIFTHSKAQEVIQYFLAFLTAENSMEY